MCPDEWDEDYDDYDDHDERHPYWHEGCDACVERANWLEARYQEQQRTVSA